MNHYKDARLSKNLRQIDVANYLGITRSAYTNIENGKRGLDSEMLSKLADLLEVSTDYLLGRSDVSYCQQSKILNADAYLLLSKFNNLNPAGKNNVIEYISILSGNPNFLKEIDTNNSAM